MGGWSKKTASFSGFRFVGQVDVVNTRGTRYSFIHEALKPLADQKLVYDNTRELKIIPKNELYERLENLYHRQERYSQIMELISTGREEESDAKD